MLRAAKPSRTGPSTSRSSLTCSGGPVTEVSTATRRDLFLRHEIDVAFVRPGGKGEPDLKLPLNLARLEDEDDLLVTEIYGMALEDRRAQLEGRPLLQELLCALVCVRFQSGDNRDALHGKR
jgi:hypothetical protein